MSNRKDLPLLIGGGALVLFVLVLLVLIPTAFKQERPPEPTATATQEPVTVVTCLGGQVFLRNARVKEYLLTTYNIEVISQDSGSFEMASADLTGIDCIWPGSAAAYDFFVAAHPELRMKNDTIFRTYLQIYTWKTEEHDYLQALMDADLVYEKDGAYFMRMMPIIAAMNEEKTWAEIGVPDIPGPVNIRYSAPERSAGGLSYLLLLANYQAPGGENGGRVVRIDQLDAILPDLLRNWESQPRQITSSPEAFEDFVFSGPGVPMVASSESLYLGWRNNLPESRRSDADLIVGIYPEWTISTDHVLSGITEAGKHLVEIFQTDPYLQQIGWDDHGMRTAVGGITARPGDTDVVWIVASPQWMGEPKQDVIQRIKDAFIQ